MKNLNFLGFPNHFIDENGIVYSKALSIEPKPIKKFIDIYGYEIVNLIFKSYRKRFKVHRLVGLAFIENTNNLATINHKNNNKIDNRKDNLEWLSFNENTKKAHKDGLNKYKGCEVIWETPNKVFVFPTQKLASKKIGCAESTIRRILTGKIKKSKYNIKKAFNK